MSISVYIIVMADLNKCKQLNVPNPHPCSYAVWVMAATIPFPFRIGGYQTIPGTYLVKSASSLSPWCSLC